MITGTHALIYTNRADEIRAFFRDVIKLPSVDAGHGWLIYSLPPAELGIHPDEEGNRTGLYLICDDINSTVADLKARGVNFSQAITDAGFGLVTAIRLPDGSDLGLYQPKHPLAPPWPLTKQKQSRPAAKRSKAKRSQKRRR
jgi:predicted enzyme related to lactoylglutathione lyase